MEIISTSPYYKGCGDNTNSCCGLKIQSIPYQELQGIKEMKPQRNYYSEFNNRDLKASHLIH